MAVRAHTYRRCQDDVRAAFSTAVYCHTTGWSMAILWSSVTIPVRGLNAPLGAGVRVARCDAATSFTPLGTSAASPVLATALPHGLDNIESATPAVSSRYRCGCICVHSFGTYCAFRPAYGYRMSSQEVDTMVPPSPLPSARTCIYRLYLASLEVFTDDAVCGNGSG